MRNIPDHVDPSDPKAPWNDQGPHRDRSMYLCDHCTTYFSRYETREIVVDEFFSVFHRVCPHCGEVIGAIGYDMTEDFLVAMRNYPDEMLKTIDRYEELKL